MRTAAAVGFLLLGLGPVAAQSLPGRTFVSSRGNDTGTCSGAAPCRSFAYAITQTAAGGEIQALDPAGYGSVTITKAVTIVGLAESGATITVPANGAAISVQAGANDAVQIRGIEIVGSPQGQAGITVSSAGSLDIVDSTIISALVGLRVVSSGITKVNLVNTNLLSNATGISAESPATIAVTRCAFSNNFNGITSTTDRPKLLISDTTFVNSGNAGMVVNNAASFFLKRSLVSNSGIGINISQGGFLYLDDTSVTLNGIGISNTNGSGAFFSFQNNSIFDNGTDVQGAVTKRTLL